MAAVTSLLVLIATWWQPGGSLVHVVARQFVIFMNQHEHEQAEAQASGYHQICQ